MEEKSNYFFGKTVLITGCSRGIGKALLECFLHEGANVLCCVRKKDFEFEAFLNRIALRPTQFCRVLEFDLTDDISVKEVTRDLIKQKLVLDILINNAGIADGSIFEMTSAKRLKEVFEINFFSQINLTQRLLRLLKRSQSGRIVNIGSISGVSGDKGTLSYGCSKSALMFATKVLANELSRYDITVNAVAPGVTSTNMADKMAGVERTELVNRSFLQRECTTSEVVNVVRFLASGGSSFVNGQIIRVDGGMSG
jgi:3-oxoacyl-[acyl-carrier protein] reductase